MPEQHDIPLLPLYDKGYTSIGCEPCTSLPFDPNDPRSGRWGGRKQSVVSTCNRSRRESPCCSC